MPPEKFLSDKTKFRIDNNHHLQAQKAYKQLIIILQDGTQDVCECFALRGKSRPITFLRGVQSSAADELPR